MKKQLLSVLLLISTAIVTFAGGIDEAKKITSKEFQQAMLKKALQNKPVNAASKTAAAQQPSGKVTQLPYVADSSMFVNYERELYTYSNVGGKLGYEHVFQSFDTTTQTFVNTSKFFAVIDSTNLAFDSIQSYNWNTTTNSWDLFLRNINTYNANNKIEYGVSYLYYAGMEFLFGEEYYTYDSNNYLIEQASYSLDFGTFTLVPNDSTVYVNDTNGYVTLETTYSYDEDSLALLPQDQYSYTNDANGNELEVIYESWGTLGSGTYQWIMNNKYVSTYNANDELVTQYTYQYNTNTSTWDNYLYNTYFYTSFNELDYVQEEKWDGSAYVLSGKTTYVYLSDESQDYVLEQDYYGAQYHNVQKEIYLYGAIVDVAAAPSNLVLTPLKVMTSSMQLDWTDNSNNEDGFLISRSTDNTNYTIIDSVAADVTTFTDNGLAEGTQYYYKVAAYNSAGLSAYSNTANATTTTGVAALNEENNTILMYPNPAKVYIQTNAEATVKIYDMTGRELIIEKTMNGLVNVVHLQNGTYTVHISTEKQSVAHLLVKE